MDDRRELQMGSEIIGLSTREVEPLMNTVELPAPTTWPIVLAFGFTLLVAGLVTSISVSLLGAILAIAGCIGWFRDVLPVEKHERVSVLGKATPVTTTRPQVARVKWMTQELHRARLPIEIYPISAGIKGGLAGSVAMAVLAVIYDRANRCLSLGRPDRCDRRPHALLPARRPSVRSHASDVSPEPDSAWRGDRVRSMVWSTA